MLLALPLYLAAAPLAEGRTPGPMFEVYTGRATFYSDSLHGTETANGERYNKHELTAAHRFLPLGTIVRVTNLSNGRHVLVRINDRGPMHKKLLLDVSKAAASGLNMVHRGVAPVQVEVVSDRRGIPVHSDNAFYVHLQDARSLKDAQHKLEVLSSSRHSRHGGDLRILLETTPDGSHHYFIGKGAYPRYRDAYKALQQMKGSHSEASVACLSRTVAENTR